MRPGKNRGCYRSFLARSRVEILESIILLVFLILVIVVLVCIFSS